MMSTELHWIDGPWPGKLAMAARPRGGDWVENEMNAWRSQGVDVIVSLLEASEEDQLDLSGESIQAGLHGMTFRSLPLPDRQVPPSRTALSAMLDQIQADLLAGKHVVLHCRQGVGRTGLLAACLLVSEGFTSARAVHLLSSARGIAVPETTEQREWLDGYADKLRAA